MRIVRCKWMYLLLSIILLICLSGCAYEPQNVVEYVQDKLEEKYNAEFEFLSGESVADSDEIIYRFCPQNDRDLIVTVTTGISDDAGMINTVIPFERHRWIKDNFEDCIKEQVISQSGNQVINLDAISIADATSIIYELMGTVNEALAVYEIPISKYTGSIDIIILHDSQEESVTFYSYDQSTIRDQLQGIINGE